MAHSTITTMSAAPTAANLMDSVKCGEDFADNFRQVITIAPEHCAGCADYHMVHSLKRLSGKNVWEQSARKTLLSTIKPIFANLVARGVDRIDVVIAACADTGSLSTCAHAALAAGRPILDRTHFTVLDRCATPLMLCDEYGARHGLEIQSDVVDLTQTPNMYPADLILVHNLLPYLPENHHEGVLHRLGSWLKDDGCLVVWNPVLREGDSEAGDARQLQHIKEMKAMIDEGRVEINEPKDVFFARLDRNGDVPRPGEQHFVEASILPNLMRSAGLKVLSVDERPGGLRYSLYTTVVAGRHSA